MTESSGAIPGGNSHAGDVAGPLAIVIAPLGPAARARVMGLLPRELRDGVNERLDAKDGERRSFVEHVIEVDVARVFAEEGAEEPDLLQEVHLLQAADPIAVVLNHATPRQAAGILPSLPLLLQGEVLHRMSAMNWAVLETRLGREESAFLHALDESLGASGKRASPEFSAAVLREVANPQHIRYLLSAMGRMDPESTAAVQGLLYGFDTLARLSDLELQTVLTGVDNWDLALALRESPGGLRRRILGNVSQRRRLHLEDDEAALLDVAEEDALALQRKIMNRARQMYEAGKLYTYLGSVAPLADDDGEDDEESAVEVVRGARAHPPEPAFGRRYGGIGAAVAGGILAFLLVWLTGNFSSGPRSGSGSSLSLFGNGSPSVQKGRRGRTGAAGSTQSVPSDFALSEGSVVIIKANGDETFPDVKQLQPGDVVKTDLTGQAVVRLWADAGQAQVDPSSTLQLGQADDPREDPPRLRLRLGNVWIHSNHPTLEVHAPLARLTASAGALYRLRVVLNSTTYVAVYEGTVWVTPLIEAERDQVVVGSGESMRIEPSGRIWTGEGEEKRGWLGIL